MKAAVMTAHRAPLEIQDVPDPVAGDADVVIRVGACGICRSDWHLWQEDWTWVGVKVELPRIPGHEFGGEVVETGKAVKRFKVGDRVTVPFHLGCGSCEYCSGSRSNICQAYGFIGVHADGGYGEFARIPNADANLVALPAGVDDLAAAALGCRYMTAYHGLVDQARVRPGEWVTVFGIGGVGLATVQIARALGARVIAISRSAAKLQRASELGAEATVEANESAVQAIRDLTGGGAHLSVDAFGGSATTLPGLLSLRKGGRHLQLGATGKADAGVMSIPVDAMLFQELTLVTSLGCPTSSYPGLLSMLASGALRPLELVESAVTINDVNSIFARMTTFETNGFNIISSWSPGAH